MRPLRRRLPEEYPSVPPTGYKVAFPMLSWDSRRVGFRGVSLGGRIVYGILDEAQCGYGRRHSSPGRGCDCGFYALHAADEAQALTCATDCREAVVLRVDVLGAFTRYERGFRYARQRVRAVKAGPCLRCGRPAEGFTLDGTGLPGWRALRATCVPCAAGLRVLTLMEFARLAGPRVTVASDGADRVVVTADLLPQLAAEAAFLQARLDHFQARLARLQDQSPGPSGASGLSSGPSGPARGPSGPSNPSGRSNPSGPSGPSDLSGPSGPSDPFGPPPGQSGP